MNIDASNKLDEKKSIIDQMDDDLNTIKQKGDVDGEEEEDDEEDVIDELQDQRKRERNRKGMRELFNGRVYAAILTSPEMSSKDSKRQIWMWETNSTSFPEELGGTNLAGKPKIIKNVSIVKLNLLLMFANTYIFFQLEHSIQNIFIHTNRLISIHDNGNITVLNSDLTKIITSFHNPKAFNTGTVIWSETFTSTTNLLSPTTIETSTSIISVHKMNIANHDSLHSSLPQLRLRLLTAVTKSTDSDLEKTIISETSFADLDIDFSCFVKDSSNHVNSINVLGFSFAEEDEKLVIARRLFRDSFLYKLTSF